MLWKYSSVLTLYRSLFVCHPSFKKKSLFTQCDSSNSQNKHYGNIIQSRLPILSRQPQSKVFYSSWMFTNDFTNYCTCWVTLISVCNSIAETMFLVIIINLLLRNYLLLIYLRLIMLIISSLLNNCTCWVPKSIKCCTCWVLLNQY